MSHHVYKNHCFSGRVKFCLCCRFMDIASQFGNYRRTINWCGHSGRSAFGSSRMFELSVVFCMASSCAIFVLVCLFFLAWCNSVVLIPGGQISHVPVSPVPKYDYPSPHPFPSPAFGGVIECHMRCMISLIFLISFPIGAAIFAKLTVPGALASVVVLCVLLRTCLWILEVSEVWCQGGWRA